MNNFHQCATKHGIHSIFCRVAHRIEPAVATEHNVFHIFQLTQKGRSVRFPIRQNNWKEQFVLMYEVGADAIHAEPHVSEH